MLYLNLLTEWGDMTTLFPVIGRTRLVKSERLSKMFDCSLYVKLELQNPTHSHKDRESRKIIEEMISQNKREAVIASTGNAAISLAALGRSVGCKIHVFCSYTITKERKELLKLLRAELHLVKGSYHYAVKESEAFAAERNLYLANPGNPAKRRGDMEIGEEISEMLNKNLTVVVPTNNGTLLSGVWEGIKKAENSDIVAATAKETRIADSIAGFHQLEGRRLKEIIQESSCEIVNVNDIEIEKAMKLLATEGIFCEPASAASLASLEKIRVRGRNVVLIITGSAFKFAKKDLSKIFVSPRLE
jgi:threonine synthase